jgi:hypothetical protein
MKTGAREDGLSVGPSEGASAPQALKDGALAVEYERGLDRGPTVAFGSAKVPSGGYTGPVLAPPAWPR